MNSIPTTTSLWYKCGRRFGAGNRHFQIVSSRFTLRLCSDLGRLRLRRLRGRMGGRPMALVRLIALALSPFLCNVVEGRMMIPGMGQMMAVERAAKSFAQDGGLLDRSTFQARMHDLRQLAIESVPVDSGYTCVGCPLDPDGSPLDVRIMFIDVGPFTMNPAARSRAKQLGIPYSCDKPELALPECFMARNWDGGWIGEMVSDILFQLDWNVTALTRANFSQESAEIYKGSSSYTRCVWEVRLGNVDLCVGDFWETDERRRIAMFTSAMDSDFFKLGTMPEESGGVGSTIKLDGIFRPFDGALWALNFLMVLVAATLMWYVEHEMPYNTDYECQLQKHRPLNRVEGVSRSLWLACMTYVFGEPMYMATTWPGKIIFLGFGWFVCISGSSYTANLASFMVSQPLTKGQISSFAELAANKGSFCVTEALNSTMQVEGVSNVVFDDFLPALEGLVNGRCQGVMVGRNEWKIMVKGGKGSSTICLDEDDPRFGYSTCRNPGGRTKFVDLRGCKCSDPSLMMSECPEECPDNHKFCKVLEVQDEDFVYYINVAMPISERIQNYISAWIIKKRQDGETRRLKNRWIDSACPDICPSNTIMIDSVALDPATMAGTFLVSGLLMLAGLIWHYMSHLLDKHNIRPAVVDIKPTEDPTRSKPKQRRLGEKTNLSAFTTPFSSSKDGETAGRLSEAHGARKGSISIFKEIDVLRHFNRRGLGGDDTDGGGEDFARLSGRGGAGNSTPTPSKWKLFKGGFTSGDGSSGGKGALGNASPGILTALRLSKGSNQGSNPGADERQGARATADIVPPSRLHSDGSGGGNLLLSSPLESGSGSGVGGRQSTTGKRVLPDVGSLNEEGALSSSGGSGSGGSQPSGGVGTTSVNPKSNPAHLRADIQALSSPGGTPTGSLVPARPDNEGAQEGHGGAQAEAGMGGIPEMYMALCDRILESQRSLAGKLQKSPPKDVSAESMSSRSKEIEDIEARALLKRVGSKLAPGVAPETASPVIAVNRGRGAPNYDVDKLLFSDSTDFDSRDLMFPVLKAGAAAAGEIGGDLGEVNEGQKLKNILFNALKDGQRGRSASDPQGQSQRPGAE